MKLSIYKKVSSMSAMLATGIVTVSALTPQAEAGVIWTFVDDGNDVTASASGSFSVTIPLFLTSMGPFRIGSNDQFMVDSGSYALASMVGSAIDVADVSSPNSHTGTFGHSMGNLVWNTNLGSSLGAGVDVSGGGTVPSMTWTGTSIDTIFGGGFFDSGPVTAWTLTVDGATASDTISYVAAVPEPSSTALLGLGAVGLLIRRKR